MEPRVSKGAEGIYVFVILLSDSDEKSIQESHSAVLVHQVFIAVSMRRAADSSQPA